MPIRLTRSSIDRVAAGIANLNKIPSSVKPSSQRFGWKRTAFEAASAGLVRARPGGCRMCRPGHKRSARQGVLLASRRARSALWRGRPDAVRAAVRCRMVAAMRCGPRRLGHLGDGRPRAARATLTRCLRRPFRTVALSWVWSPGAPPPEEVCCWRGCHLRSRFVSSDTKRCERATGSRRPVRRRWTFCIFVGDTVTAGARLWRRLVRAKNQGGVIVGRDSRHRCRPSERRVLSRSGAPDQQRYRELQRDARRVSFH
jgi:hypothetical protein